MYSLNKGVAGLKKIVNNIIYLLQFIYLTYITILLSLVSSNIMERSKVMETGTVGGSDSSYSDTELDVVNEHLQTFRSDMELKLRFGKETCKNNENVFKEKYCMFGAVNDTYNLAY